MTGVEDNEAKPDTPKAVEVNNKQEGPPPQQAPGYNQPPPPPGQPYPMPPGYPPAPFFTAANLNKFISIGVLICVIMLFVGNMINASAYYMDLDDSDDYEAQRNRMGAAIAVGGIGLFILGLFAAIAFLQIRDLTDHQKLVLGIIVMGTIFALAILVR
jgi:hypothetical protein